ncbi:DUF742 domain-containing protein [Pseudonocardia endophytica]|uniref:Uncharacterized protein DUF742 n=1 Tax=Pseudonocardia endophytica TaxID=401976 RepID=A0A4R1HXI5_PSEEN|nr:DUF742 domain-containing protein [Pseudonocardia endophytica]TCK26191.1 uncharacterized protein DUF742 [Pseudonocardia endophytica]
MTEPDRGADRHRPGGDGAPRSPVRPYALTGGRTAHADLPPETVVAATVQDRPPGSGHSPEATRILELCRPWRSVAELSALLRLPLGVVKVLVQDLDRDGAVHLHHPSHAGEDTDQLERALRELRKRI